MSNKKIFREVPKSRSELYSAQFGGDVGFVTGIPESGFSIKPTLPESLAIKIIKNDGSVQCLSRDDYANLAIAHKYILANSEVLDPVTNRSISYNNQGVAVENKTINKEIYEEFAFTGEYDVFGKYRIPNVNVVGDKKIEPSKVKKEIDFNDLMLILNSPVLYFKDIKRKISNMNSLVLCMSANPDQFDEAFTIEVKGPESPLLKKYIDTLADLVNLEIGESDEIEDIEILQKLSYENVGYVGKKIETVIEEAKDFKDYFRFLLTKKEKKVVNQEDYEFAKTLGLFANSKLKLNNKRNRIEKEIILDDDNISYEYYFSDKTDILTETSENITVMLFINSKDILNVSRDLESNNIDIRIGLLSTAISKNYNDNNKPMYFNIFAYDENFNFKVIEIKSSTINKYKRKFCDLTLNFDKTFKENKAYLINKELKNFNSI